MIVAPSQMPHKLTAGVGATQKRRRVNRKNLAGFPFWKLVLDCFCVCTFVCVCKTAHLFSYGAIGCSRLTSVQQQACVSLGSE